jgi:hypothetical protein
MDPFRGAAVGRRIAGEERWVNALTVGYINVCHCHCLEIQSTIIDQSNFLVVEVIAVENEVHNVHVVFPLSGRQEEVVDFEGTINSGEKLAE